MQRPTFEEIYMSLADTISKRSTCSRLKVGTVITSTDYRKVLALGYNGAASGLPNGCERDEPGNCGCATHAELNAMINCDTPRYVEKIVYHEYNKPQGTGMLHDVKEEVKYLYRFVTRSIDEM